MGEAPCGPRRLNLFEVVNHTLRESLLALSGGGLTDLRRRVRGAPPPEVRHWSRTDVLDFEVRVMLLAPAQAEGALRRFLGRPRGLGWRMIPWRDGL